MISISKPFLLLLLALTPFSSSSRALGTYQLETNKELTIFGTGLFVLATGHYGLTKQEPVSEAELARLNRRELPPIDRRWAGRHNKKNGDLSHHFLLLSLLINPFGGSILIAPENWRTIAVLGAEVALWTGAGIQLTKGWTRRHRPRAYPGSPLAASGKLASDQVNSFISGHAAAISSSFAFASSIFAGYHPHSPWKIPAYIGAGIGASVFSWMRVEAGAHFPSDVIAGIIWGGIIGFSIPAIHQSQEIAIKPWTMDRWQGVQLVKNF